MLDEAIYKMERYVEGGWLTGLKYEDEILADLEKRTDSKPNKLKTVSSLSSCPSCSLIRHPFKHLIVLFTSM